MGTIQLLYNSDVLDEDAIRIWYNSEVSKANPAEAKLRERVTKFIEWLDEAEEEESDDDDDDAEDEDSDDE